MQIFSESTDRIQRSMRKVQLVAQGAKVHMRWTPVRSPIRNSISRLSSLIDL